MTVNPANRNALALGGWRKSSYSGSDQGSCVEVADGYEGVPVRDSKVPQGPALVFPAPAWSAFVRHINGEQPLT
ncbi:DUF397 domain-containing protein [Streptomyces sp. NPDC004609]|uniref:DUF397 domain-containing protein n=1 Tax=Streptomyces sp. NPDC004609 TaxID=3364704 RepID=UPI0036870A82